MQHPSSSLTDRTLHGFLWLFAGKGTQAALHIVVLAVLARLITPAQFGIVGAALVVIGFSQIFSELGVGPAIVQRAELSRRHMHAGFTISIVLSCTAGAIIFLTAPLLALSFRMPDLEPVVRLLALIFPITGPGIVAEALLQRDMQFRQLTAVRLIGYLLGYGVVGISMAIAGWGVWALVMGQLSQALIGTIIYLALRREAVGFWLGTREARHLLAYGAGLSLTKIANHTARQIDNLVVGRWLGDVALGVYGRAYQFLMMPANLFGSVTNQALFPAMASVQKDRERLMRAYTQALSLVAMVTLPASGILVVLAPEMVEALLGPQWDAVVTPFRVLAAFLLFRTSYKISDSLVRALGAVYESAWRQLVYATAVFLGAWIGHFRGLGGVALGVGVAVCLHFVLMLQLSIRLSGASWRELGRIHLRHLLIMLAVTGVTWAVAAFARFHQFHTLAILFAAVASAMSTVLLTWWLGRRYLKEEISWISMVAGKVSRTLARPT